MKIFLLLHGGFLAVCLILRFLFLDRLDFSESPEKLVMPFTLIILLVTFLLAAVTMATSLLIALRFYRNMFSREGYLSWTLPASASQHLLAKFISGYVLAAADIVVIALGLILLLTGANITETYSQVASEMEIYLGASFGMYALKLFLFSGLFAFTSVIQIYFSIVLGQLFAEHRVLFALAFYFLTGVVIQIIFSVVFVAMGISGGWLTEYTAEFNLSQYTDNMYLITGIVSGILAVVEYIAANHIMKRRINLI